MIERFDISSQIKLENAENADGKQVIRGLAVPYGQRGVDLGGQTFRQFRQGSLAFADKITLLYAHDDNHILGGSEVGSLRLTDTDEGLLLEADPPVFDTYIMGLLEQGLINGLSVGVLDPVSEYHQFDDGSVVREITQATLFEVSLTRYPVFEQTNAELVQINSLRQQPNLANLQTLRQRQLELSI